MRIRDSIQSKINVTVTSILGTAKCWWSSLFIIHASVLQTQDQGSHRISIFCNRWSKTHKNKSALMAEHTGSKWTELNWSGTVGIGALEKWEGSFFSTAVDRSCSGGDFEIETASMLLPERVGGASRRFSHKILSKIDRGPIKKFSLLQYLIVFSIVREILPSAWKLRFLRHVHHGDSLAILLLYARATYRVPVVVSQLSRMSFTCFILCTSEGQW